MQKISGRYILLVSQMKIFCDEIEDKKLVKKVLISLYKEFDPIVAVIEETKYLSTMMIQVLMGSLQSFEWKLLPRSKKSVESAFQSKLNFNRSNSFRGGRQGRGRGRRNEENTERGQYIYYRKSLDEEMSQRQQRCDISKGVFMWKKIVSSKANLNVIIVKNLDA